MTGFMQKIADVLLLTEWLEQIHLEFEGHRDCSDEVDELDWYSSVNTGVMRSSQACIFGYGILEYGSDYFEASLKVVRRSQFRGSDCQSIVAENTNGNDS